MNVHMCDSVRMYKQNVPVN